MDRSSGARTGAVIEPLLAIERDDLTGTLDFEAREVRTRIHAVAGEIVFAEGGTVGETLGRLLLRSQRLAEEPFAGVIRRMLDLIADDRVVRFGEVLVEYGFLDPDELDLALMQQVRDKIVGCVHRGDGRWTFEPKDAADVEVSHHVVRLRPALVEATEHLPERRIEEILHLGEHRYPEIVAPERVIAAEFELSADEASVLLDLNGTSSLHFILPKASSPKVGSLIAALVLGGGVELRTTPSAGTRGEQRPVPPTFVTLRRAVGASEVTTSTASMPDLEPTTRYERPFSIPDLRESHASYSTVSAKRVPDRRPTREALGPSTEKTQERTRRAEGRLRAELEKRKPTSDRRRWPEPMDDRERRLLAEAAFQQGRLFLRAEESERALPGLARAHELRPDAREYELYVKWAQMLVNDTFRDERRRAEMEELAAATLHQDPWCELAFSILGHCAFHGGKEAAALRFFQRAAHLDPKRVDASRLGDLAASQNGTRGRTFSFPDARSRARGELRSMLDEVVPQPIVAEAAPAAKRPAPRTTRTLRPAPPETAVDADVEGPVAPERQTPFGGLAVSPAVAPPSQTGPLPPPLLPPRSISKPPSPIQTPQPSPVPSSSRPRPLPPPSLPPARVPPSRPPPSGHTGPRLALPSPELRPPTNVEPPPSHPPAPAPTSERPSLPPANIRTPAMSPWRIPTTPTSTGPHPVVAAPPSQPPAPPPTPAPMPATAVGVDSERPSDAHAIARAKRPRLVALAVVLWVGALGAAAAIFHVAATEDAPGAASASAATATIASSPPSAAPAPTEASPASAPTDTTAPPSPAAAPSASGKLATTGILRVPRAVGRRIYVDGHIYGEGGKDLTVPCGSHKVRVGSAGTDHVREIPCGSVLEL